MRILHPTDFSECAEQALARAVELARALDAEVVLLHVPVEAPLYGEGFIGTKEIRRVYDEQRQWAIDALDARAAEIAKGGVAVRTRVTGGVPFEEIVRVARDEQAYMIVMGTHGRGGLARFLLGSVADRVIRLAPCPVVTVRLTESALPAGARPVSE